MAGPVRLEVVRRLDRADVRHRRAGSRRARTAASRRSPRASPAARSRTAAACRHRAGRRAPISAMTIGPSHRAGGPARSGAPRPSPDPPATSTATSKSASASAIVDATPRRPRPASGPRGRWVMGRDLAEVLDRLGSRPWRRGRRHRCPIAAERLGRHDREARRRPSASWAAVAGGALEQPVDDDDRGARQLVAAGDRRPDVLAVVDEELQVEPRRLAAGVAVAGASPARCSGAGAGRRGRRPRLRRGAASPRPARPRRTGTRRRPRTSPAGTAARGARRSSRGGRPRSSARARSRRATRYAV